MVFVASSEKSDYGQSMELKKGGMGGIIGFGFRYIKYLMCIQSEPKQSVSLAVHRNARCRREHVEKRTGCKKVVMMLYLDGWTQRIYAKPKAQEVE